jgi:hypothetical protein
MANYRYSYSRSTPCIVKAARVPKNSKIHEETVNLTLPSTKTINSRVQLLLLSGLHFWWYNTKATSIRRDHGCGIRLKHKV